MREPVATGGLEKGCVFNRERREASGDGRLGEKVSKKNIYINKLNR
jgi:hypothetical protein